MLKWAVTSSRGSPISTSGPGTTPGGETAEGYVAAWPTYEDVRAAVAQPGCDVRWATQDWISMDQDSCNDEDGEDGGDSLSAYDENSATLERLMGVDFTDDSQV